MSEETKTMVAKEKYITRLHRLRRSDVFAMTVRIGRTVSRGDRC